MARFLDPPPTVDGHPDWVGPETVHNDRFGIRVCNATVGREQRQRACLQIPKYYRADSDEALCTVHFRKTVQTPPA